MKTNFLVAMLFITNQLCLRAMDHEQPQSGTVKLSKECGVWKETPCAVQRFTYEFLPEASHCLRIKNIKGRITVHGEAIQHIDLLAHKFTSIQDDTCYLNISHESSPENGVLLQGTIDAKHIKQLDQAEISMGITVPKSCNVVIEAPNSDIYVQFLAGGTLEISATTGRIDIRYCAMCKIIKPTQKVNIFRDEMLELFGCHPAELIDE